MTDYIWFWKKRLPERKGQPCRVLIRGRKNSILVEFEDGYKVVTSRYAVRKIKPDTDLDKCRQEIEQNIKEIVAVPNTAVNEGRG